MTCEFKYDEAGKLVMIACGSPWGMGVTTLHGEDAEEFGGSIYGFGHGGNPYDFEPDEECCTKAEIAAWEEAKAAWDRATTAPGEGSK